MLFKLNNATLLCVDLPVDMVNIRAGVSLLSNCYYGRHAVLLPTKELCDDLKSGCQGNYRQPGVQLE